MNILEYYIKKSNILTRARSGIINMSMTANRLNELNDVARTVNEGALSRFVEPENFWEASLVEQALFAANSMITPPTPYRGNGGDDYDDDSYFDGDGGDDYDDEY